MTEYLSDDEDAFAELLARKTDKELLTEQKRCEEELQKAMTRNDTVSRLYEKLYEDNATGNSIMKRSRPPPAPYIKPYQNRKIEWS